MATTAIWRSWARTLAPWLRENEAARPVASTIRDTWQVRAMPLTLRSTSHPVLVRDARSQRCRTQDGRAGQFACPRESRRQTVGATDSIHAGPGGESSPCGSPFRNPNTPPRRRSRDGHRAAGSSWNRWHEAGARPRAEDARRREIHRSRCARSPTRQCDAARARWPWQVPPVRHRRREPDLLDPATVDARVFDRPQRTCP